ncbi:YsnF/AvaK domain-containing protein [Noviherbaspirillum humi]|nr:YsnF/AvaK domain-containing protein [Noviherbaspirillum humi]
MDDDYRDTHDVYAESVRRGHYVVTVNADSDSQLEQASDILNRFNPVDVDQRAQHWRSQGWAGYDENAPQLGRDEIERDRTAYAAMPRTDTTADSTADTQRIPVIQEELKVGKRMVQRGGVRVFQRVRETPVNEEVRLREEQVKVERHPVDRPASEADFASIKEGAVELRETAEEAVVSKTARVVEEVEVGKEVRDRTEQINDTVRRTDVEVEQLGAGDRGMARTDAMMADDDTEYRRHWQNTYGTSGGRYEDYGDAYRYGSQMAGADSFKNYRWEEAEPQLRSDWERDHPGSTWEKVKDAVRYSVERARGHRTH